jgi:hypothetical protein
MEGAWKNGLQYNQSSNTLIHISITTFQLSLEVEINANLLQFH